MLKHFIKLIRTLHKFYIIHFIQILNINRNLTLCMLRKLKYSHIENNITQI